MDDKPMELLKESTTMQVSFLGTEVAGDAIVGRSEHRRAVALLKIPERLVHKTFHFVSNGLSGEREVRFSAMMA